MSDLLSLGDLSTPALEDVTIERNGEIRHLQAYKAGARAPGLVKGKISSAKRDYDEATNLGKREPAFDPETGEPELEPVFEEDGKTPLLDAAGMPVTQPRMIDLYQPNDEAWFRLMRQLMQIVIPGLQDNEADLLSGDDATCLGILQELGWWPKPGAAADASEGEAPGEASATPTPISSPSSPTVTK
jgi:hypothetical protein